MSTAPIPVHISPIVFEPVVNKFHLISGSERYIDCSFNNQLFTIPPWNKMDRPEGIQKPYGRAAFDSDGEPIPGTLELKDTLVFNPETGRDELVFDSTRALHHILGLRRQADGLRSTSRIAFMGVSYLPPRPTKEIWKAVLRESQERAILFEAEFARSFITSLDAANAIRQGRGDGPLPGGPEYARAKALLEKADGHIREALGMDMPLPTASTDDTLAEDPAFIAFAEAEAMKLAKITAAQAQVDELELAKRLLGNIQVRKGLMKDFRIRRVGHMVPKEKDLDKMLEMEEQRQAKLREAAGLAQPEAPVIDVEGPVPPINVNG